MQRVMRVLVCSADPTLSGLLARNLGRRGFSVRQIAWDPCGTAPDDVHQAIDADAAIVDIDCPEPDCWRAAGRARMTFPSLPVVFLMHAWPDAARLRRWRPCASLHKPFAVDELLRLLRDLAPAVSVAGRDPTGAGE